MKNVRRIKVPRYKKFMAILISLFIVTIPFISHLKIMFLEDSIKELFGDSNGIYIDLFLQYKKIFIVLFAVFIFLFFIGERIFPDYKLEYPLKNRKNKNILILACLYCFIVYLSYIFSDYKALSYAGSPTDGEGLFVLISYMILFLAGINYFYYEKSIEYIKKAIVILSFILIVLSFIEFFYKPIFEISFFQNLLASKEYYEVLQSIKNNDYKDMVSLSLYNPNYFGGLCILLFPILMTFFINEVNKKKKIMYSFLTFGMIFCIVSSKTTAAIYIMFLEILFLILYERKKILESLKFNISLLSLIFIIVILINYISDNKLISVAISGLKNSPSIVNNKEKFYLEDINLYGNKLEIVGENNSLNIVVDTEKKYTLNFYDRDMNELNFKVDKGKYTFEDSDFKNINIEYLSYGIIVDIGYNDTMEFYIKDNIFKGVGQNGREIEDIKRDKYILKNFYSLATGRGYVWINTLPIIKDNLLFGTGPGSFSMYFKQNDYIGLMNTHGSAKFIIDKPHNMYLQVLSQTGIISLISILAIFYIFIRRGLKIFFKDREEIYSNNVHSIGFGIFIGILGFLIISLVNDSIVTVNPIFWILLGVGFSILDLLNIKDKNVKVRK